MLNIQIYTFFKQVKHLYVIKKKIYADIDNIFLKNQIRKDKVYIRVCTFQGFRDAV